MSFKSNFFSTFLVAVAAILLAIPAKECFIVAAMPLPKARATGPLNKSGGSLNLSSVAVPHSSKKQVDVTESLSQVSAVQSPTSQVTTPGDLVDSSSSVAVGTVPSETTSTMARNRRLTMALSYMYLTNVFCSTLLSVVVLPMVGQQVAAATTITTTTCSPAAWVTAVASIATLGGAVGRLVNGFVCQAVGGRKSCSAYLATTGASALCLSLLNPSKQAALFAPLLLAMEFFSSIQWTAALYLLGNHFDTTNKADKTAASNFAAGVTTVTLASTVGILGAKVLGPFLLQIGCSWKLVAQLAGLLALSGAAVMGRFVTEYPRTATANQVSQGVSISKQQDKEPFSWRSIGQSLKAVCGTRLFWLAAFAHGLTYLSRQSDRILGTFFQHVSGLPQGLCGGLTASITLGFVHGVVSGKHWPTLAAKEKKRMFARRYQTSVVAALMLAVTATDNVMALLPSWPWLKAGLVALASGLMASSLSYQFYQMPPAVASLYGKNRAVVTSFLNAMGFLVAAPVWAVTAKLIQHLSFGWAAAWTQLALLFGVAGACMLQALPPVLAQQSSAKEELSKSR